MHPLVLHDLDRRAKGRRQPVPGKGLLDRAVADQPTLAEHDQPIRGQGERQIMNCAQHADTAAMQLFLDKFSETIAEDEHAVMILDQAGWHGANDLAVPANITLVPLPPYSPELNPVERVWLYLKERFLSHRLLDDYDAIVEATCNAWNRLTAEIGRIKTLCSYPWIPQVNT